MIHFLFITTLWMVAACSSPINRAKSSRELNRRNSYKRPQLPDPNFKYFQSKKRVRVYIHPHQTESGDYFEGGTVLLRLF